MKLQVSQITLEADRIISIKLRSPSGEELPPWQPGAHLEIDVLGRFLRHYSLCGDLADRQHYSIAVLRELSGRGGSQAIHDSLRVGALLDVRRVANHFQLVDAPFYNFVAGGIGITPIISMVEHVNTLGRPWRLTYAGRCRSDMAFVDRLCALDGQVRIVETGAAVLVLEEVLDAAPGLTFACGPAGMLDALGQRCELLGMSDRLVVERFKAAPIIGVDAEQPFDAVISSSGQTITVPAQESLLQCLLDAGCRCLFSCREGTCGSCEVGVIEGELIHRDAVLSEAERLQGDRMLPCVSRAKGRVVLDL
ncbi:PDR/VanB family oxidoreductase [Pseudomonas sessilinigenes]|uniref:PDR/VanB family oxidoreductase n=1 Tax=Pseudomonas sessilinigenes TaxID=658629 RepID=A0ABX8MVL3_9PSED|nr:PDR/VanB family oxidoreductase [Pseudomonas sessilinigenes]AZC24325.1 Flavodoxin reductase (ferredoxin-NADPH reductase) family 1 [Pseudomonas sessilinigenes]QXH43274.1 PDR/VanB family oxidoreductase [Pseudomonas sessilinigenes]